MAKRARRAVLAALLVSSALFCVVGCSSRQEKVAAFVARGDQLLKMGDPTRASLEYKNALQIDPRSQKAVLGLGKAYLSLKEYRQAYSLYAVSVAAYPGMDEVRLQLAWLLTLARQAKPALEQTAILKHKEKFRREATIIEAVALLSLKRCREATTTLGHIEGGERDKDVQMVLARAYAELKDWQSSLKAAKRWRALAPGVVDPYLCMAKAESEMGDGAGAAAELHKMVKANPSDPRRAVLEAQALEALGLSKQAQAAFERLPDGKATLMAKADYWARRKNGAKERAATEKLAALLPGDVDTAIRLAQLDQEQNDLSGAMAVVDKALQTDLKKTGRENGQGENGQGEIDSCQSDTDGREGKMGRCRDVVPKAAG